MPILTAGDALLQDVPTGPRVVCFSLTKPKESATMLDRELLADMGFVKGTGWDHEVWVYEGAFWVHFGGETDGGSLSGCEVSAGVSRREFFEKFIDDVTRQSREAVHESYCRDE